MFWFHFYAATQRGTLNTKWAREKAVDDLILDTLANDEAIEFLRLASDGLYDAEDMPGQWCGIFERMERESVPDVDQRYLPSWLSAGGHVPPNRAQPESQAVPRKTTFPIFNGVVNSLGWSVEDGPRGDREIADRVQ